MVDCHAFVPRVKTIALLVILFCSAHGSQHMPTYDCGNQYAAPMPLLRRPSGSENHRFRLLRSRESTHAVCLRESRSVLAGINTPPMTFLCSRKTLTGINTSESLQSRESTHCANVTAPPAKWIQKQLLSPALLAGINTWRLLARIAIHARGKTGPCPSFTNITCNDQQQ